MTNTLMYLSFAVASLRDELTPLAGDEKGFPVINDSNTVQAENSTPQIPR